MSGKIAAEPASLRHATDKGQVHYALMDLTCADRREYYNGFANRGRSAGRRRSAAW